MLTTWDQPQCRERRAGNRPCGKETAMVVTEMVAVPLNPQQGSLPCRSRNQAGGEASSLRKEARLISFPFLKIINCDLSFSPMPCHHPISYLSACVVGTLRRWGQHWTGVGRWSWLCPSLESLHLPLPGLGHVRDPQLPTLSYPLPTVPRWGADRVAQRLVAISQVPLIKATPAQKVQRDPTVGTVSTAVCSVEYGYSL